MRFPLRTAAVFAAVIVGLGAAVYAERWELVKRQIERKFPSVPKITTAELAAILASKNAAKPLLLDVRTQPEYDVSHLAGARRVDPEADAARIELPAHRETPIVTYCSVGYRSASFAERLRAAGFTNVRNLEGSIFQWANEDRPLIANNRPAEKVHPYNALWGSLLKPARRAETPPAK